MGAEIIAIRRVTISAVVGAGAGLALALAPAALAAPVDLAAERGGPATFSSPEGLGACALPQPRLHAAINTRDFRRSAACGQYVRVTRGARSVVVQITNRCPDCGRGGLELSPAAFRRIGDLGERKVPVTWRVIAPPRAGPISFRFDGGSDRYWMAIQVRNHRTPIARLDVFRSNRWVPLRRVPNWNHFVTPSAPGPGPFRIRVIDAFGGRVISNSVRLRPGKRVPGAGQLPAPPPNIPVA
jgi:expansin